jgi:hypothetical protein
MSILDPRTWFSRGKPKESLKAPEIRDDSPKVGAISPGRVSEPDTQGSGLVLSLRDFTNLVESSFRRDVIPLIRDLYKINPDVSIALQDMFKLANTGHTISFPKNTPEEATKMREHLMVASKSWTKYTAGIDGLVNKFTVQCLTSGAISIEAVPNNNLNGISTVLFINPEQIYFRRLNDGVYHPYQKNPNQVLSKKPEFIKLNNETYKYLGMYNDTDEPYGVPPFMAALDSLKGQHDMRINFKHIMELVGMVGFLEAKMEKPTINPSESRDAYARRLEHILRKLKMNLREGLKDNIVVGFKDDHEFKLNSTTKEIGNIEKPWAMNQQSVANGLGVNGSLIGVQNNLTEGGTGILLSKMISQLRNIQTLLKYALEFLYTLELRLAGYNNKGVVVTFGTSTISDELKVQQGIEYKIRNLVSLYNQGIISQEEFAWSMGYEKPDQKEPRQMEEPEGVSSSQDSAKKQKREADKDTSDRKTRDKNKTVPKRADQDSRPR